MFYFDDEMDMSADAVDADSEGEEDEEVDLSDESDDDGLDVGGMEDEE